MYKLDTVKLKLSALWTALMVLYIYCDIFSFFRPGHVEGMIGPFEVSQTILAAFGALMMIPALMIPACLFLRMKAAKWANVVVGGLYTVVNIGNLIGETWAYYWIYGLIEIAFTVGIIIVALRWRVKAENKRGDFA